MTENLRMPLLMQADLDKAGLILDPEVTPLGLEDDERALLIEVVSELNAARAVIDVAACFYCGRRQRGASCLSSFHNHLDRYYTHLKGKNAQ